MRPRQMTRKLEVFALHARTNRGVVNYPELLAAIAGRGPASRVWRDSEKLVALPVFRSQGPTRYRVTAVEGPLDTNPLIFNATSADSRVEELDRNEVLATRTHALFDLTLREVFVEYNQRGAKAEHLKHAMTTSVGAAAAWAGLDIQLTPIASQGFVDAINDFDRVRVATLRVSRPNIDWNDNFNHLAEVGQESDAGAIEITVTANRGGSLSKRHGVVDYIRNMFSNEHPSILGARVVGSREGEGAETSISLEHHVEHQRVRVTSDENGHVVETEIWEKLLEFSELRRQQRSKRQ